jgi:TM2 domain-containing membrane protein YozV
VAIAALLINILVIPGVGSLIGGRTQEGIAQIILLVAGVVLLIILVGIFMIIAAWIWGIVTGVQIVKDASP